jgi:O-antigen/teichoic acid export membrane protein
LGTWAATIIIARILSPSDYGLVGMAGLITGIIMLFGDFGLGASIIQKRETSKEELSTLFYILTGIGGVITLIIFFIAPLGGSFFKEQEVTNLIRLSSIIFLISSITTIPRNLIQKEMKFKLYGIIDSFAAMSTSIVVIILAVKGLGAYSLIWGMIFNSIISMILFTFYSGFKPTASFSTDYLKMHLKFGGAVTLSRYLWWYYCNVDYILAGKILGKNAFGLYSMAFQLASLPLEKLASIINPVSLPAFSSIGDRQELIRFYFNIVKYLSLISFPIFCGFFWIADDAFPLLLGAKWNNSILIFKILSIPCMFRCLSVLNSTLVNSIRRPDVGVKNMFLSSIVATIALLIGVNWGANGLAVAWLVFYPPVFIVFIYSVSKAVGFSLSSYFSNIRYALLCTILMSICIFITQSMLDIIIKDTNIHLYDTIRLTATIITGLISYVLSIYILDRDTFKGLIRFVHRTN